MKTINQCYLTRKVKQYVLDLIQDYDYDSYSKITHADKCVFVAYLIEAAGKNAEHEFLLESNHLDQTINAFTKALLGTREDDENFLYTMKDNAVSYFEDTMQAIFEEVLSDYQSDKSPRSDEAYESFRGDLR